MSRQCVSDECFSLFPESALPLPNAISSSAKGLTLDSNKETLYNSIRDTRLAQLDAPSSRFSSSLLATVGLLQMGLGHRITHPLDTSIFPYAVGQGALGVEVSTALPSWSAMWTISRHDGAGWRSERCFEASREDARPQSACSLL